jgi:hypothetical protein
VKSVLGTHLGQLESRTSCCVTARAWSWPHGTRAATERSEDTSPQRLDCHFVDLHSRRGPRPIPGKKQCTKIQLCIVDVLLVSESRVASRTHLCDENKEEISRA